MFLLVITHFIVTIFQNRVLIHVTQLWGYWFKTQDSAHDSSCCYLTHLLPYYQHITRYFTYKSLKKMSQSQSNVEATKTSLNWVGANSAELSFLELIFKVLWIDLWVELELKIFLNHFCNVLKKPWSRLAFRSFDTV